MAHPDMTDVDAATELLWVTDRSDLVDANAAFERTLGYSTHELCSRPWRELLHPVDRGRVAGMLAKLSTSKHPAQSEGRFRCKDGTYRLIGWTAVAHDDGMFYAAGRELVERHDQPDWSAEAQCLARDSHVRLRTLAGQHEGLRRIATLVARGVGVQAVFSAVTQEIAQALKVCLAAVLRHESDDEAVVAAAYRAYTEADGPEPPFCAPLRLDGDNAATRVLRTGRPARMDSETATGPVADQARELGIRTTVAAPIKVDGRLWGLIVVGSPLPRPLPPDTESRIAEFADLIAIALGNAAARAEVIASRARIVAAADNARRGFERDLHDGAQQQLISLALKLRLAETSVPPELCGLKSQLSQAIAQLNDISHEVREISHGLHPASLSRGGLGTALKTLARRSTVPVTLEVDIDRAIPDSADLAAYYITAEALTNAAKHARASEVKVCARADDDQLCLDIADNGVGGADSAKGSGLIGLIDRVAAFGGRIQIQSPPGGGTSLAVCLPIAHG